MVTKDDLYGKTCVFQTDTILGVSALYDDVAAVEKITKLKQRDSSKGFIILISSIDDLQKFSINILDAHRRVLERVWPGPVSVVLKTETPETFSYLSGGQDALAFRLPDSGALQNFLQKTGPIVSTSVNISGNQSIHSITGAQQTFGDAIDMYIENDIPATGQASTVISILR